MKKIMQRSRSQDRDEDVRKQGAVVLYADRRSTRHEYGDSELKSITSRIYIARSVLLCTRDYAMSFKYHHCNELKHSDMYCKHH